MTPEEEAYAEALHRIHEAEETGEVELDLSKLSALNRLPRELERLTSLQTLDLSSCEQLSGDLAPLAGLTALRTLDLSHCWQLSDLGPLSGLTSLQRLDLYKCLEIRDLRPVRESVKGRITASRAGASAQSSSEADCHWETMATKSKQSLAQKSNTGVYDLSATVYCI